MSRGQVTVDSPNGESDSQVFLSHPYYGVLQHHMFEQAEPPFLPPPSPHHSHLYRSGSQDPLATFHPYGSSSYFTPGHGIFTPSSPPTFSPQATSSIVPAHTTQNFHVFPESLSMHEFSDARDEPDFYTPHHQYSAMFVGDENMPSMPSGPVATQAAGNMPPYYTAYMPEQGTLSLPLENHPDALVAEQPNAPYPTTSLDQGQNDNLQTGAFGIYPDPMEFLDSTHGVPGIRAGTPIWSRFPLLLMTRRRLQSAKL
ncbi:hypothetical protein EDB19DRAFT_2027048 [Suillus lakei]|nr:hypothetical protein EDB19DRAFT_2027048 [Suillus lakei]